MLILKWQRLLQVVTTLAIPALPKDIQICIKVISREEGYRQQSSSTDL